MLAMLSQPLAAARAGLAFAIKPFAAIRQQINIACFMRLRSLSR